LCPSKHITFYSMLPQLLSFHSFRQWPVSLDFRLVSYRPSISHPQSFNSDSKPFTVIVGIIYTVLPIVGMIVKPLFGAIADRYQRHKSLFLFFQLLTGVAFLCIMFIPSIGQSSPIEFHCNGGETLLKHCLATGEADSCSVNHLMNDSTNGTMSCKVRVIKWP
jgi:MFS family permease